MEEEDFKYVLVIIQDFTSPLTISRKNLL